MLDLERKQAVKRCLDEFQQLVRMVDARDGAGESASERVSAFRSAIEELVPVACEIEARLVGELKEKLSRTGLLRSDPALTQHIDEVIARLDKVSWLPGALSQPGSGTLRLYFVRHAESTGNEERRLQGSRIPGALTPLGHAQSRRTAEYLFENFADLRSANAFLVSSPIGRALESAWPISDSFGCPLATEADLSELDFGDWSGRYFADLEATASYRDWMEDKWFNSPPAGESLFEVRTRMCQAVSSILSRAATDHRSLIIVTHFFPLVAMCSSLFPGMIFRPDNSSISIVEVDSGRCHPRVINYVAHLGKDRPVPVAYV